ncbi:hypothetical protein L484_014226 [Morus notabilis]|uniref:DUF21 domain-containing protein n=1 Tax=Morus notabilis TaxID=981085 RepID=W9S2X2_9ROSA|nr:hypothetical protein L484_014226 [Morus notabilis]
MAVVVKCEDTENTENNATGESGMLNTNAELYQNQSVKKGIVAQEEHLSTSTETSPLYSSEIELQSATLKNVMEQDKNFQAHDKRWRGRSGGKVSLKDLEEQPSNLDEEVIGIITLEDVMEALLQVDNSMFINLNFTSQTCSICDTGRHRQPMKALYSVLWEKILDETDA